MYDDDDGDPHQSATSAIHVFSWFATAAQTQLVIEKRVCRLCVSGEAAMMTS